MGENTNSQTTTERNRDSTLNHTEKTLQDYEVISLIDNGAFGTCYKVRDKNDNNLYTWKAIDYEEWSDSLGEALISEIYILQKLRHPNILQYYHHLMNKDMKSIFIIMEFCDGETLLQVITKARKERKRFEEQYIWRVLFQICKVLQLCHNKIQNGALLYSDIKVKSILIDCQGNVKLGGHILERIIRQMENIEKISADESDTLAATGCLIYEMCTLRPSAKLSTNTYFNIIPQVYSKDLQEIITLMLESKHPQISNFEMILRHPILIRNIIDLSNDYPTLIDTDEDFCSATQGENKFEFTCSAITDFSSTMISDVYNQNSLQFDGGFTPEFRSGHFSSTNTKKIIHRSNPELYQSVRHEENATMDETILHLSQKSKLFHKECKQGSHASLDHNCIFKETLENRLHSILEKESILEEKENALNTREQQLILREQKLKDLERNFNISKTKSKKMVNMEQLNPIQCTTKKHHSSIALSSKSLLTKRPPTKAASLDDTYCTIDPNDSLLQTPTVAKLNLASLSAANKFTSLRKVVTFQTPKKFTKYDIENIPPELASNNVVKPIKRNASIEILTQSSFASKINDGSSNGSVHRARSVLSIFGLNRNRSLSNKPLPKLDPLEEKQLSAYETTKELNIWTKEHKRAAFELLAAMNAADDNTKRERNDLKRSHRFRKSICVASQSSCTKK